MSTTQQLILPISELSSYTQKWTIRARVTSKSQLRTFAKGNNQGKLFHVNLLDAQGGEIRASFFNDAVDKFFDTMQTGKCFTLSRGSLKIANKQFNPLNHRYEATFDKNAEIVEVADDSAIDAVKLTVSDLRSLESRTLPCNVDLCGIVIAAGPSISFTSRDGKELVKREVTIADDTATSLQITLWGDRAKQNDAVFEANPVMGFKSVVIKEWQGGRTGSLLEAGAVIIKPVFPEAQKVQQWWTQGGGSSQTLISLSQGTGSGNSRAANAKHMNLAEMRHASESLGEKPELYSIVCRLAIVQTKKQGETQPLYYNACQEPREGTNLLCNRRVDGSGHCGACNRVTKSAPRLNIRCRFADFGDSVWMTTFHEAAEQILGMKAEDMHGLENGDGGREALEAVVAHKYFDRPFQVILRAKLDSYNGEPRSNITCVEAKPLSLSQRAHVMLDDINAMLGSPSNHVLAAAGA